MNAAMVAMLQDAVAEGTGAAAALPATKRPAVAPIKLPEARPCTADICPRATR